MCIRDSVGSCAGLGQSESAQLLTLCERNQVFLLLLFCTICLDWIAAQRCMCRNDNSCSSANLGKLLYAHSIAERIAALSAVLLRDRNAEEAQLRHLLNGFPGEGFRLVNLLSKRLHFLFGKISEKSSRHFMLFA